VVANHYLTGLRPSLPRVALDRYLALRAASLVLPGAATTPRVSTLLLFLAGGRALAPRPRRGNRWLSRNPGMLVETLIWPRLRSTRHPAAAKVQPDWSSSLTDSPAPLTPSPGPWLRGRGRTRLGRGVCPALRRPSRSALLRTSYVGSPLTARPGNGGNWELCLSGTAAERAVTSRRLRLPRATANALERIWTGPGMQAPPTGILLLPQNCCAPAQGRGWRPVVRVATAASQTLLGPRAEQRAQRTGWRNRLRTTAQQGSRGGSRRRKVA